MYKYIYKQTRQTEPRTYTCTTGVRVHSLQEETMLVTSCLLSRTIKSFQRVTTSYSYRCCFYIQIHICIKYQMDKQTYTYGLARDFIDVSTDPDSSCDNLLLLLQVLTLRSYFDISTKRQEASKTGRCIDGRKNNRTHGRTKQTVMSNPNEVFSTAKHIVKDSIALCCFQDVKPFQKHLQPQRQKIWSKFQIYK